MNLTKFLPPKLSNVLVRERLVTKLKSWDDKKLVMIHAQAGQGKSTLAAEYIQSLRSLSIWYNIDEKMTILWYSSHLSARPLSMPVPVR